VRKFTYGLKNQRGGDPPLSQRDRASEESPQSGDDACHSGTQRHLSALTLRLVDWKPGPDEGLGDSRRNHKGCGSDNSKTV